MADRANPRISSRKEPKQARSSDLVTAILEAATQVLAAEGARHFTTARVAERAGVSIGSLYQYFPNKAAILYRLQSDEWRQTHALLETILTDVSQPPLQRLRRLVHAFLLSECEEAALRIALDDAAPLYRDAPEAKEAHVAGQRIMQTFMREALPHATPATRRLAADLVTATFTAVGNEFSETPRTAAQIRTYADAMADMFCAYLERIGAADAHSGHSTEQKRHPHDAVALS